MSSPSGLAPSSKVELWIVAILWVVVAFVGLEDFLMGVDVAVVLVVIIPALVLGR